MAVSSTPGVVGQQPAVPLGEGHGVPGQEMDAPVAQDDTTVVGGLGEESVRIDEHKAGLRSLPRRGGRARARCGSSAPGWRCPRWESAR